MHKARESERNHAFLLCFTEYRLHLSFSDIFISFLRHPGFSSFAVSGLCWLLIRIIRLSARKLFLELLKGRLAYGSYTQRLNENVFWFLIWIDSFSFAFKNTNKLSSETVVCFPLSLNSETFLARNVSNGYIEFHSMEFIPFYLMERVAFSETPYFPTSPRVPVTNNLEISL